MYGDDIWWYSFYDCDSSLGLDNTGYMKFESDIEPSQPNVYNCSTSKMWVKLNEFFQPELFNNFKALRESDYTYEKVCEYLIESQIDQIADILYNEDMYSKYISQGRRYLHMLHGNNKAHLLRWLYNRFLYVDSLFLQHNSPYTKQAITIRSCKPTVVPDNLPENVQYIPKFEIETYTPQYVTICWRKNTYETKRVGKGERVIFENPMTNSQDNELIVYCANNLKRIGDCTDKNPTSIDIGSATRLVEFKCENSTELLKADLSNNKYLKTISFRNCTNLGNTTGGANVLDVSGCTNLRYLDIYNTGITSVLTNVDGGNLEEIYYPTGIQNIVVRNQTNLKVLGVPYGIPTKVMPTEFVEGKSVDDLGNIIDSPSTEERTFFVTTKLIGTSKLENCSIYLRGLSINETYFNLKSYCYFYDDNGNYLGVRHLANRYYTDAHKPHNDYVSTIDYKTQMISSEDYPNARYCRLRLESTLVTGTRLLYPNILNRCLVVDSFDNTVFTHHECDKLTTLDILNCNNIEMLNYRGGKDFTAFKHTKNLSLQNSLRAEELSLEGFNSLKTLSIRDMLVLKNLSFAGMTDETDDSNLTSAIIANCPNLTRLLLAENVDTKFGQGGVLDLRNTSLVSIESLNACIKGLKSIYLPRSIKDLIFTYKGETGEISDIENIWSYNSVEKNIEDGYVGIDLEGAEIRDIVLETVVETPTIRIDDGSRPINSFVTNSTLRDGVTYPYIKLLGTLDLSEYIGLLTDLFARCDITELNIISNKNLTKTDASRLFNYAIIGDCDLSDILSKITSLTNCSDMFQSCITNGEIKGLNRLDVSKVTSMYQMFHGCSSLTSVPITEIPDSVTDINNLFNGCVNLKDISGMTFGRGITTATSWIPPNLETANNVTIKNDVVNFAECRTLKYANNFTFDSRNASRIFNKTGVIQVNNLVITNKCLTVGSPSSGIGLFSGCSDLESIDFANCDLSNVTEMRNLCSHTPKLKHVYNLKTSGKLQYFGLAFYGCSKLTTISGISDWNVSNVTNMNNMFCGCSSLTSLDVSDWNVSSVTNMNNMFYNCSSLTSLDVSDWNVSSVTNMDGMFYNCSSLTSLDVSDWNVSSVTNMYNMFYNCSSLTSVPILEIPDSVTNISGLFNGCTNLKDIRGMTFGSGITTASNWIPPNLETANNVTIKNNVVSFNGCATLKYCNNLRSYYTKTFSNCKNLIEINNLLLLGEDGKEVKGGGISLFRGNSKLEKITFSPDCNCTISSFSFTFLDNPELKEIDFGGGVRVNFGEQGYIIGENETPNIESIKNLKVLSAGSTARLAGYGASNFLNKLNYLDCTIYDNSASKLFKRQGIRDVSNIKFDKSVTNLSEAFMDNLLLESDIIIPSHITDCSNMFKGCTAMTHVHSNWDNEYDENIITTDCYNGCTAITHIDDKNVIAYEGDMGLDYIPSEWGGHGFTKLNTAIFRINLTSNNYNVCISVYEPDVGITSWGDGTADTSASHTYSTAGTYILKTKKSINTSSDSVTLKEVLTDILGLSSDRNHQFRYCQKLKTINMDDYIIQNIPIAPFLHQTYNVEYISAKNVTVKNSGFGCLMSTYTGVSRNNALTEIVGIDTWKIETNDISCLFKGYAKLKSLDISSWDLENVTNMSNMFEYCESLTESPIENFPNSVTNISYIFKDCTSLTRGITIPSHITNCSGMFQNCTSLTSIPIVEIPNSVTDISNFLNGCTNLKDISGMTFGSDITTATDWIPPNLETANNITIKNDYVKFTNKTTLTTCNNLKITSDVTNLADLFSGCNSLVDVGFSEDSDVSNVRNIQSLFKGCSKVVDVEMPPFDYDNMENMWYVFRDCSSLIDTPIRRLTSPCYMIYANCASLTKISDVYFGFNDKDSPINTFLYCNSLKTIENCTIATEKFNVKAMALANTLEEIKKIEFEVVNLSNMFEGCVKLKNDIIIPSHATNCSNMFKGCTAMTHVHSNWENTYNKEITTTDCYAGCTGITHIDDEDPRLFEGDEGIDYIPIEWGGVGLGDDGTVSILKINVPSDGYVYAPFAYCYSFSRRIGTDCSTDCHIKWGDGEEYVTGESLLGKTGFPRHTYAKAGTYYIKGHIGQFGTETNANNYSMLNKDRVIEVLKWAWRGYDVSRKLYKAKDSYAENFKDCTNLTSVRGVNIHNGITSLSGLFQNCSSLVDIDMNGWDLSAVNNAGAMFHDCSSLTSLDIGNWNVGNATNTWAMFYGCSALSSLDISNWNMEKVNNISYMFYGCNALTSLDVSEWDVSSVNNISTTFYNCASLEKIILPNMNVGEPKNLSSAFRDCPNLRTIQGKIENFYLHEEMFKGTPNIETITGGMDFSKDLSATHIGSSTTYTKLVNLTITGSYNIDAGTSVHMWQQFTALSVESLVQLLNALVDLTGQSSKNLVLGSTNLAKLSASQIKIATDKNWSLV